MSHMQRYEDAAFPCVVLNDTAEPVLLLVPLLPLVRCDHDVRRHLIQKEMQ